MPTLAAINAFLQADETTKDDKFKQLTASRANTAEEKQELVKYRDLYRDKPLSQWSADELLVRGLIWQHNESGAPKYDKAWEFYEKSGNQYSYTLRGEIFDKRDVTERVISEVIKANDYDKAVTCFKRVIEEKEYVLTIKLFNYLNQKFQARSAEVEALMTEILPEMMSWLSLDITLLHVDTSNISEWEWYDFHPTVALKSNRIKVYNLLSLIVNLAILQQKMQDNFPDGFGYVYRFAEVNRILMYLPFNAEVNNFLENYSQNLCKASSFSTMGYKSLIDSAFAHSKWIGVQYEFKHKNSTFNPIEFSVYICCKIALHPNCDENTLREVLLYFKETLENKNTWVNLSPVKIELCKFYLHFVNSREIFISPEAIAASHADIDFVILREAQKKLTPAALTVINQTLAMVRGAGYFEVVGERLGLISAPAAEKFNEACSSVSAPKIGFFKDTTKAAAASEYQGLTSEQQNNDTTSTSDTTLKM